MNGSIALTGLIAGGAVLGALLGLVAYVTLLERKFAARMQSRVGPYRVGPHGILQPIADGVKLLLKEDIVPDEADKRIFSLAPLVFGVSTFLMALLGLYLGRAAAGFIRIRPDLLTGVALVFMATVMGPLR